MTTKYDSLRIDKAIRDAVAFGGLPLTGRFEAGFAAVLDLHKPQAIDSEEPDGPQYCPSCVDDREPFADYPCPTIRAIARELRVPSVSGEDTAPAARQPRVWLHRGTGYDPDPGGDVRVVDCHGDILTPRDRGPGDRVWETPDTAPFRWDYVLKKWGPLTEVVSPEGPA